MAIVAPARAAYDGGMERDALMDDFDALVAALAWQVDLGADEALCETPVNRFELPETGPALPRYVAPQSQSDAGASGARDQTRDRGRAVASASTLTAQRPPREGSADAPHVAYRPEPANEAPPSREAPKPPAPEEVAQMAQAAAAACGDIAALRAAVAEFEGCSLRMGARGMVFSDGHAGARVMVVLDPPSRAEDQQNRPMVGDEGTLFTAMFDAIGLNRDAAAAKDSLYLTSVLPWCPPHGYRVSDDLIGMTPFLRRHIELANPDILVLMGNSPAMALMGRDGVTRLRGAWHEVCGRPTRVLFPPSAILKNTGLKRLIWADLLDIKARLLAGAPG